jgi:hypothetical protein
MTLYDDCVAASKKPLFSSYKEALEHYTKEYEALGAKHGMTGDQFWEEAESSCMYTEDYSAIMKLRRSIQFCHYAIKEKGLE